MAANPITYTPRDLAIEIGCTPKALRRFLRENFPRPEGEKYSRWVITEDEASAARFRFSGEEDVTEILTETLGSIPTRVIVVEELANCGVISSKKATKRIMQIMEEHELRSVEIETLPHGGSL